LRHPSDIESIALLHKAWHGQQEAEADTPSTMLLIGFAPEGIRNFTRRRFRPPSGRDPARHWKQTAKADTLETVCQANAGAQRQFS
jgi:hypothetical protein